MTDMATRLYIASDFHAAEKAWRKFLNAISMNVYKADVALLAGDLTGKAIVPIIQRDGRYEADLFGVHRSARGEQELAQLERDIADVGYYSFVTSGEEADRLSGDEGGRHELLERLMRERLEAWMALATSPSLSVRGCSSASTHSPSVSPALWPMTCAPRTRSSLSTTTLQNPAPSPSVSARSRRSKSKRWACAPG